uniref:Protein kinase domain-containing protein n=1 Tax=Trichuris muris TaxID=70415 RepID=A0A5S6QGC8_TRIMR
MFRIEDIGADSIEEEKQVDEQIIRSGRKDSSDVADAGEKNNDDSVGADLDTCGSPKVSAFYKFHDDLLGSGAFAVVKSCVNRMTEQEFAVKIIKKDKDNHIRKRVWREIQTFYWCSGHPNIVSLIEYFEENDKFFLIFEKMRGGSLLQHIQRRVCFTEWEASLVVRDIASALSFLHNLGIAHRDVKPENILCTHPENVTPVKLCDLDLASTSHMASKKSPEATRNDMQSPVGSAEFMAPEVVDAFMGEKLSYDKRCDLWSLGVILYMMLCGYPPFYGECSRVNCGWQKGLPCDECQSTLFSRIQSGKYQFHEEDWSLISEQAKDLIRHLLVRDAEHRYFVSNVLAHPWVADGAPMTPLKTPDVLMRNESARDLNQLAEDFVVANRIAFSESCEMKRRSSLTNGLSHNNHLPLVHYPVVRSVSKSAERKAPTVAASGGDGGGGHGSELYQAVETSAGFAFGHRSDANGKREGVPRVEPAGIQYYTGNRILFVNAFCRCSICARPTDSNRSLHRKKFKYGRFLFVKRVRRVFYGASLLNAV